MSISIVIVNYNSANFINSIEKEFEDNVFELIVVDNSQNFIPYCDSTKIVVPDCNLGFGNACNLGVERASNEKILFLNPDAKMTAEQVINISLKLNDVGKKAIIGGLVSSGQSKVSTLSKVDGLLFKYKRHDITLNQNEDLTEVLLVSGACMAMYRDRFISLGGFCKGIFLYAEDLDLCERNISQDGHNFLFNGLNIPHIGGASTSNRVKLLASFKRLKLSFGGHYTFMRKNNGVLLSSLNALVLALGIKL